MITGNLPTRGFGFGGGNLPTYGLGFLGLVIVAVRRGRYRGMVLNVNRLLRP